MENKDSFGNELPPEGVPFTVVTLGRPIGFALRVETNEGPHTFKWQPTSEGTWECSVEFECGHCDEMHDQRQPSLDASHPAEACGQLESLACSCWVGAEAVNQIVAKEGEELLDMSDDDFQKWLESFSN